MITKTNDRQKGRAANKRFGVPTSYYDSCYRKYGLRIKNYELRITN